MNQYTFDDIKILGEIFDQSNELQNLDGEDRVKYASFFTSITVIKEIYKENSDLHSTLMTFLGNVRGAGTTPKKWSALHTFLYKTPLKEMALHLNDSGEYFWKSIVAKWRLQIKK